MIKRAALLLGTFLAVLVLIGYGWAVDQPTFPLILYNHLDQDAFYVVKQTTDSSTIKLVTAGRIKAGKKRTIHSGIPQALYFIEFQNAENGKNYDPVMLDTTHFPTDGTRITLHLEEKK